MISYFDSSSIVKWFFDEPGAALARSEKDSATIAFTSIISLPEVMSAFSRAFREDRCTPSDLEQIRGEFLRVWPNFQKVKINESLVYHSGQLVFIHNLCGFDSVHLASALVVKNNCQDETFFSCFDHRLNRAAHLEGLTTH